MKRGVRLPWRVAYRWSNDIKGTKACSDQETAEFKADEIRRAGQRRDDASVVVTVTHRDAGAAGQADYQAGWDQYAAGVRPLGLVATPGRSREWCDGFAAAQRFSEYGTGLE